MFGWGCRKTQALRSPLVCIILCHIVWLLAQVLASMGRLRCKNLSRSSSPFFPMNRLSTPTTQISSWLSSRPQNRPPSLRQPECSPFGPSRQTGPGTPPPSLAPSTPVSRRASLSQLKAERMVRPRGAKVSRRGDIRLSACDSPERSQSLPQNTRPCRRGGEAPRTQRTQRFPYGLRALCGLRGNERAFCSGLVCHSYTEVARRTKALPTVAGMNRPPRPVRPDKLAS